MFVVVIIYMILGYWATGKTIFANSVLIGTWNGIFIQKACLGTVLGWVLIPWAIIKVIMGK